MRDEIIVLVLILTLFGTSAVISGIAALLEIHREQRWRKTLNKKDLLDLEDELKRCLGPIPSNTKVEDIIKSRGYTIQEKPIMMFRQGYTTKRPKQDVYVWKYLTQDRRRFTLAHELMHIIYHPEELDEGQGNRNRHSFLRMRDLREQERDYMAASILMPREKFWQELIDADYFNLSPKSRRDFVYRAAQEYNVETSTVFRRISELKVIMK